jgi:hypothetical protein
VSVGQVFYSILLERSLPEGAVGPLFDVNRRAGELGYRRIHVPYTRTEIARNKMAEAFLGATKDPDDVLVMLDCDHEHPEWVVERLAGYGVPIVAALAFRRGEPFDPQAYLWVDGEARQPSTWQTEDGNPLLATPPASPPSPSGGIRLRC